MLWRGALFIYGLFNNSVSNSDSVAWSVTTVSDSELERTWKDAAIAQFDMSSRHFPEGTD